MTILEEKMVRSGGPKNLVFWRKKTLFFSPKKLCFLSKKKRVFFRKKKWFFPKKKTGFFTKKKRVFFEKKTRFFGGKKQGFFAKNGATLCHSRGLQNLRSGGGIPTVLVVKKHRYSVARAF